MFLRPLWEDSKRLASKGAKIFGHAEQNDFHSDGRLEVPESEKHKVSLDQTVGMVVAEFNFILLPEGSVIRGKVSQSGFQSLSFSHNVSEEFQAEWADNTDKEEGKTSKEIERVLESQNVHAVSHESEIDNAFRNSGNQEGDQVIFAFFIKA